jgi:MFS family permease
VASLTAFTAMIGTSVVIPLLPLYAQDMGASGLTLGAVVAVYSISKALVMPFMGRLSDRYGRKRFLSVGLFIFALFSLTYIVAASPWHLILIRLLQGAAGGMIIPIARATAGDVSPKGEEGRWMGYFNAAFVSGIGFGPIIGGVVADNFGMVPAFSIMAGMSFLAFVGVLSFLPETRRGMTQRQARPPFSHLATSRVFLGVFTTRITENVSRRSFVAFLPIFAAGVLGLSITQIGLLLTINALSTAMLQGISGRLTDRLDKRHLIVGTSFFATLYMALIPEVNGFWLLLLIILVNSARAALNGNSASALMVIEGRKYGMATVMAMFSFGVAIGEGLGPIIAGALVDAFNVDAAFYTCSLAFLVGGLLFGFITRRHGTESDQRDNSPVPSMD